MGEAIDVLAEDATGTLRVRLVQDLDAGMPEDAGSGYVYAIESRQCDVLAGEDAPELDYAIDRFGTDWDRLERYLRMFHDAVSLDWYDRRGGGKFLMVVTSKMAREWTGGGGDWTNLANLSEWEAWDEGDVYGYVVEQLAEWETVSSPLGLTCTEMHTWEYVDSCWGFYGHQYASRAAVEALASTVEDAEGDR